MAAPELRAGVAVHYPGTGPGSDGRRSHILVIVKAIADAGDLVAVPICSAHPNCDRTCLIEAAATWPGVIRHASYAAYYQAKKLPLAATIKRVEQGEVTYLGDVPIALFNRIVAGISVSDESEPWLLKALLPPPRGRVLQGNG